MAATELQVKAFERAHKDMYISLVIANRAALHVMLPQLLNIKKQFGQTSPQYVNAFAKVKSYLEGLGKLYINWTNRQREIEKSNAVEKLNLPVAYLLSKEKEPLLVAQALKFIDIKKDPKTAKLVTGMGYVPFPGIGIIPLIVWGVIAIAASISAAYIVNETTTTAQEKTELMTNTAKTLSDLNITGDKAAAIISQTQKEATDTGGGIMSNLTGGSSGLILPLGLAAVVLFMMNKNKAAA